MPVLSIVDLGVRGRVQAGPVPVRIMPRHWRGAPMIQASAPRPMPVRWIENEQASRPQFVLFVNGDKVCTISHRKDLASLLDYWTYQEPGCESVTLDALTAADAKAEAVNMVKQKLLQMSAALEAFHE